MTVIRLIIKVKEKEKSPLPNQVADTYLVRKLEDLDIRSCLQFLLEQFEQWLLPSYSVPRTPLMLKMEAIRSVSKYFLTHLF